MAPRFFAKPWYRCHPRMVLGEAPIYRASDSTLHWVDCLCDPPQLHVLKVDTVNGDYARNDKATVVDLCDSVSAIFFRKHHARTYICVVYQGIGVLEEATGKLTMVRTIIPTAERAKRRLNDAGIDSHGRLWVAEIDIEAACYGPNKLPDEYGKPKGGLYRFDPNGSLYKMDDGYVCGNGVKWSPDDKTMYVNDSVAMKSYKYNFNVDAGTIGKRELFKDFKDIGEPDGLVLDAEGNLWIAVYGSNSVVVLNPKGEIISQIWLAARNPTCPTWAGKENDILYVTSARDRENKAGPEDQGGHMFRFQARGVKGLPKNEFEG